MTVKNFLFISGRAMVRDCHKVVDPEKSAAK
jgi:hypothetical protein